MTTSAARLAANRANAQHSTGPRTSEGKAASARNSLQHGARATAATIQSLPNSPYPATLDRFTAIFAPATPAETLHVERCAALDARLQLVRGALDALLDLNGRRALSDHLLERYNLDRPDLQLPDQPDWSPILHRYDENEANIPHRPNPSPDSAPHLNPTPLAPQPGLDLDLPGCSLAYTLTSPRGLALLSHETGLDRRLQSALNALDRLQRANQLSSSAPSHVLYPAAAIPSHGTAGATPNRGIAEVSATNLHQIAPLAMPPDSPTPTSPTRQHEPNEPAGPSLPPSIRIDTIEPNNPSLDIEPDDPPLGTATLPDQNEPDSPSHAPSTPRGTIEPNNQAPATHTFATIEPNRPLYPGHPSRHPATHTTGNRYDRTQCRYQ